jgi:raffinose/stachyose/melibiose transport system substrate-binding protein
MRPLKTLAVCSVTAAMLLATACSSGGGGSKGADVNGKPDFSGHLSILTASAAKPSDTYFKELIAEYTKKHPKVKIKLSQETDDDAIKNKEKVLIASQSMPDIYFSYAGTWGGNFADNGLAADLTDVIKPGTTWGDTFGKAHVEAFKYGEKYYGIPFMVDAKFMGYNEKIFKDSGVAVPKTFEQMISSCSVLKSKGYMPIAFGNKEGWAGAHYLGQLLAYDVPRATIDKDLDPATAKFTDPGYVVAMKQFKELVSKCAGGKDVNGVAYTTSQQELATGKAAMYYQELIEFTQTAPKSSKVYKDGFGVMQLPAPKNAKGDPRTLAGAPEGFMINSKSKQAALALDFMKFVTNKKNATKWASAPYDTPSPVKGTVTSKNSSASVVTGTELVNKAPHTLVWLDQANAPAVGDAWVSISEGLVSGSVGPEKAVKMLQKASASEKK